MEDLDAFLSSYGYWVFFAVGFAEFVGVPIVRVPVLIGGGAMVASGTLGFWGVVVLMLVVLAAAWRLWKVRFHKEVHRRMNPTAPA